MNDDKFCDINITVKRVRNAACLQKLPWLKKIARINGLSTMSRFSVGKKICSFPFASQCQCFKTPFRFRRGRRKIKWIWFVKQRMEFEKTVSYSQAADEVLERKFFIFRLNPATSKTNILRSRGFRRLDITLTFLVVHQLVFLPGCF